MGSGSDLLVNFPNPARRAWHRHRARHLEAATGRCANGQQLKCLTVTDEFTKEGLAIDVDGRIRSPQVIEVLSRLVSERGAPVLLRSDNGPEFVSKALLFWIAAQGADRARQALAEWRHRELQRQVPRRMPQPRMVSHARRSKSYHRELASALQRRAAAFEPWLPHAERICSSANKNPAPRQATGRGAAVFGASTPRPVAPPAHIGHMQQMGAVLKLAVVRRIWAGQYRYLTINPSPKPQPKH